MKAPLPDPWKPCQSKDGEIFYYNTETKQSTWEHPCDNYYRSLYQKEKTKGFNNNKMSSLEILCDNNKKGKPSIPPIKQLPSPMFGQSKEFINKEGESFGEISLKSPILMDKSKDPLILSQKNKKIEAYREKKEKEFEEIKKTLDLENDQKQQEEKQAQLLALQKIEADFKAKLQKEQNYYMNEIQTIENTMKSSKSLQETFEVKLKKELFDQNQRKLQEEINKLEEDFKQFQIEHENSSAIELQQELEKLQNAYQTQIEELDKEILHYQQNNSNDEEFDELEFLSNYRNSLKMEYETKFTKEKQQFLQKIELELQEEINKEMENHQIRLQEIEHKAKELEETINKMNQEELEYCNYLETDYENKVKVLKDEFARKFELEKLIILEKNKELELEQKNSIRKEVLQVIQNEKENFEAEKNKFEEDFQEKIKNIKESNAEEDQINEEKIDKIHEDLVSLKQSLISSKINELESNENEDSFETLSKISEEIKGLMEKKNGLLEQIKNNQNKKISNEEKKNIIEKLKKINEKLELMIKLEGVMQEKLLQNNGRNN